MFGKAIKIVLEKVVSLHIFIITTRNGRCLKPIPHSLIINCTYNYCTSKIAKSLSEELVSKSVSKEKLSELCDENSTRNYQS